MDSPRDLLRFVLQHDHVVVFGNLGRYPNLVFDMVADEPSVVIKSPYYLCPANDRVRVITTGHPLEACDLYVVLEPEPFKTLEKPPLAGRLVVFTSHLTFASPPDTVWTRVCYFHDVDRLAAETPRLLRSQEASVQTHDVKHVRVDAVHRLVIRGRTDTPLVSPDTFVVVDLTAYTRPFVMTLAFLDAFDYMVSHREFVGGWVIAFPLRGGRKSFEQFVQNCVDALFCKTFEHGNVTSTCRIAGLLPYYRSGSIDRTFDVPLQRFVGVEYVAPADPLDACRAATAHNLEHWAGNVYRVIK